MPLHSLTTSIQQTTIRIRRFINRHLITIQSRYEHHGDEKWSSVIRVMYEYFCIMDNIDSLATSLYENRYISRFWEVDQQVRSQNDSRKFVVTQFNIDKKKKRKTEKAIISLDHQDIVKSNFLIHSIQRLELKIDCSCETWKVKIRETVRCDL